MRSAIPEVSGIRLAQYLMGTLVEITVFEDESETARQAATEALREFERIEGIFSRFDPGSEITRVNSHAAGRAVAVSSEFFELAARGLQYSRYSAEAFSVVLQPLVTIWECAAETGRFPSEGQLRRALALCDPRHVVLNAAESSIRFSVGGTSLNFDGLAKGYATDRARAILLRHGLSRAMIDAGSSSIAVIDADANRSPWRVAVRHPGHLDRIIARLCLHRPALSTSGTGARGSTIAGRWLFHVIDPATGLPLEEPASATAVGEYAELMEVASKIMLLRGCRKGLRICEELGWAADGLTISRAAAAREFALEYPDNFSVEIGPEYDAYTAGAN